MAQSARTPGPPLSPHPATTVSHSSFKPMRSRNKHQVPTPFHGLDLTQNEPCPDEFLHSQARSECLPGPGSAPDQAATERVPALLQQPAVPREGGARGGDSHHSGAGQVPAPALCSGAQESAADGPGKPSQEGATGTAAVRPPPLPVQTGDLWGWHCRSHGCAAKATDVHGATGRAEHGVKRPKQQRTTTTGRGSEREGEKLRTRRQKAPSTLRRSGKSRNKGKTAAERRQWGSCTVHGVHRAALGALHLLTRVCETSL